jgi:excinuclease UvrABC ATPase subunit
VGEPRCPDHDVPLAAQTVSQMVDNVLSQPEGKRLMLLAPIIKERKASTPKRWKTWQARAISAPVSTAKCDLSDPPKLELQKKHTIEVVIDRFKVRDDLATRLAESFETALDSRHGRGFRHGRPERKSCSSPPTLPARFAATACASWNRACSRSTTRRARARRVTVWASSSISTRTA